MLASMLAIEFPEPMLATEGGRPFTSDEFIYEIKFDGYRCLAGVQDGQVELRTRNLARCTKWFPEIGEALKPLAGGVHLMDGEAVHLDEIGRSDFARLHRRALKRRWYEGCDPVTYAAFDLMMKDGVDLRGRPLVERKALLRELLAKAPGVLYVSDLPAEASLFAQAVLPLKLEGFIAKRKDSQYTSGLSPHWIKIKRPGWQEGRTWRN